MRLVEFSETMPKGLYDPEKDSVSKTEITDTRKDKLTLRDLNRLKKLRAFRRLNDLRRRDYLSVLYGQGGDDEI